VAGVAWAAFVVLEPRGLGWLVLPAAVALTLGLGAARWVRLRRRQVIAEREASWAEALLDPARRPEVIEEVRRAVHAADDGGRRARLTALLSELLDVSGRRDEAREILDGFDRSAPSPVDGGVLRHAHAVFLLRAGEPERALEVLSHGPPRVGDREIDLRLELIRASARLEVGEAEQALETATRVRRKAAGDEALIVEARVVRAAALDALGQRDEAIEVVRSLGPEMLRVLETLGQPRVRGLAEEAS